MRGDVADIQSRLRLLLPSRWFATATPNLDAILRSLATPWAWLYNLIQYAETQSRISTATDSWLDLIAYDFFGGSLARASGEADSTFRTRISWTLLQGAATRSAIHTILLRMTGFPPTIFEPQISGDTGGYCQGPPGSAPSYHAMAYGITGGWGNLNMPLQFFITVRRPMIEGISMLAGYGTAAGGFGLGMLGYVDLENLPGAITDKNIADALSAALPLGTVAWLQIT